jgi:hypothetical protein
MEPQQQTPTFANVDNIDNNIVPITPIKVNNPNLIFKISKISLYLFIISATVCAVFGIISIWSSYAGSRIDETFGVIATLTFFVSIIIRITEGKRKI